MAIRALHEPGALVHFRHWDARDKPKDDRPGVVDRVYSGNLALFYGSTFKHGGYPIDAIEANPRAAEGTDARALADHLDGFVDEPTFFHGTLVAETPLRDGGLRHFSAAAFPDDRLEDLQEQAEDRLLGFVEAWRRMSWLPARARVLDALWWKANLDLRTETLLTLLLCDGWSVDEVAGFTWHDLEVRRGIALVSDEPRWVLPHTLGLLVALRRQMGTTPPWSATSKDDIVMAIRNGWEIIVKAAKPPGRRSLPLPTWEQIKARIDR